MNDAVSALATLGFSELEAAVYVALLESPDLTGYAVAQRIGKPTANTYKAIESLSRKGALMDDGGDPRCYRAVPAEELLQRLARDFSERTEAASRELGRIATDAPDDRVYQLQGDVAQVLARARAMVEAAEGVVVADLFPNVMSAMGDCLGRAAGRGVAVFIRGYVQQAPARPIHYVTRGTEPALGTWPGQHLGLAVDAREHLFALFDRDLQQVRQAVWSASPYLSCLAYNHIAMEWRVVAEVAGYHEAEPPGLIGGKVSGFDRLVRALGGVDDHRKGEDGKK